MRTRLVTAVGLLLGAGLCLPPTSATASATASAGPMAGRTIVLDPGHDGGNASHPATINRLVPAGGFRKACDTAGTATATGYAEHAFTWDLAQRLAVVLRARGARVVLTRSSDTGVGPCVDVRGRSGQVAHADTAISLHADGGPVGGRGFHLAVPGQPGSTIAAASRRLALALRGRLDAAGLPRSTYVGGATALTPRSDLAGLNLSTVPKVLVELGNMRNPRDAALQSSAAWRQRVAVALADGLARRP